MIFTIVGTWRKKKLEPVVRRQAGLEAIDTDRARCDAWVDLAARIGALPAGPAEFRPIPRRSVVQEQPEREVMNADTKILL